MSNLPKVEYVKIDGTAPNLLEKIKAFRIGSYPVSAPPWWVMLLFLLVVIAVSVSVIVSLKKKTATPTNVKTAISTQLIPLQNQMTIYYKNRQDTRTIVQKTPAYLGDPIQENENSFVNFAPLTCQDTGYIGPLENGVFAESEAVSMALRSGARCFILNIDYHEDQTLPTDLFGKPGEPRLIYRDAGGALKCLNTGDIQFVTQALSNMAFSNTVSNSNDPLIVVLYFLREPKGSPDDKLVYMSKVAEKLSPLIPYHLGQTPQGDYHRQQKQNDILYEPIMNFEKKVIFISNLDTSLFRTKSFPPTKDLDYYVHMRLFKESTDTFGATSAVDAKTMPRAIVNSVTNMLVIPQDKYKDTADSTKMKWTIAYSTSDRSPSVNAVNFMTRTLGVQCIPVWMFSTKQPSSTSIRDLRSATVATTPSPVNKPLMAPSLDDKAKEEELATLMANWALSSYIPKPKAIRFVRPSSFTPGKPSPKLDANQGNLTKPTL